MPERAPRPATRCVGFPQAPPHPGHAAPRHEREQGQRSHRWGELRRLGIGLESLIHFAPRFGICPSLQIEAGVQAQGSDLEQERVIQRRRRGAPPSKPALGTFLIAETTLDHGELVSQPTRRRFGLPCTFEQVAGLRPLLPGDGGICQRFEHRPRGGVKGKRTPQVDGCGGGVATVEQGGAEPVVRQGVLRSNRERGLEVLRRTIELSTIAPHNAAKVVPAKHARHVRCRTTGSQLGRGNCVPIQVFGFHQQLLGLMEHRQPAMRPGTNSRVAAR